MTRPPGLRILMAKDAGAGIASYSSALAPNADTVVAPRRRRAMRRAAL
jgi:hypothetical protein